jgi:hypothetical protein
VKTTVEAVAPYLREIGLLSTTDFLAHEVVVVPRERRNANFAIYIDHELRLFLKCYSHALGQTSEMAAYSALSNSIFASQHMVSLLHTNHSKRISVFSSIAEAQPIWQIFVRDGADTPELIRFCDAVGRSIAHFHRMDLSATVPTSANSPPFRCSKPGAFALGAPSLSLIAEFSNSDLQLLSMIQSEIWIHAGTAISEWTPNGLIHGDLKLDNILCKVNGKDADIDTFIVDWESAQIGEFAWDIAGIIQDLIALPLRIHHGHDLSRIRPYLRAVIEGYAAVLPGRVDQQLLIRVIKLVAIRLLQTAHEISRHSDQLLRPVVLIAQLCQNIFKDPVSSTHALMGD